MTNLPASFSEAIKQNHSYALKIEKYIRAADQKLNDDGVCLSSETLRAMANDAWASYVEFMQAVLHKAS